MTRGKTLAAVHGASSDHSEEGGGTLTIRPTTNKASTLCNKPIRILKKKKYYSLLKSWIVSYHIAIP